MTEKHNLPCIQDKNVALIQEKLKNINNRQDKFEKTLNKHGESLDENTLAVRELTTIMKERKEAEENQEKKENTNPWWYIIITGVAVFLISRIIDII